MRQSTGRVSGPRASSDAHERTNESDQGEMLPALVWSCLRGRLPLTAAVAACLGLLMALGGYLSTKPAYTSEGKVRIAPSREQILYRNQFNETTPYFMEFVKTEATRLRSGPVHDRALEDPALAGVDWPDGPVGRKMLQQAVRVDFPIGEVITIRVTTGDGATSEALLNAVLRAYLTMQDEQIRAKADSITLPLGEREHELRRVHADALAALEAQVAAHGGVESLTRYLDTLDEEGLRLQTLRREIAAESDLLGRRVALRLADYEAHKGRMLGESGSPIGPSPEGLYLQDTRLAQLLDDRGSLERRIQVELESGLLMSHPSIIRAQQDIALIDSLIDQRMRSLVEQWWAAYHAETIAQEQRITALDRQLTDTQAQQEALAHQRSEAATALQRVTTLADRADEASGRLQQVLDRREQIGMELARGQTDQRLGQAEILQWGDLPLWPTQNSRKLRAAAGLMAGGMLGVGLMVAYGLAFRRYRYTDEVAGAGVGVPLLGTMPMLAPRDLASPDRLGMLAHQLRTAVEMGASGEGRTGATVHAVTSATAGEGKSTVAVALASSFAASGQRTLLVDADAVGGAVTHRFGLESERGGFCEASRRLDAEPAPLPTRIEGLDVLPVGDTQAAGLPASSLATTQRLFDRLRGRYDRIVVDIGVLAGSAEAAQCCRAADGIIAVVARGQSRAEVDTALGRLAELGLWCEGLVFNRAQPQDAARYTSVPASGVGVRSNAPDGPRQASVSKAYS